MRVSVSIELQKVGPGWQAMVDGELVACGTAITVARAVGKHVELTLRATTSGTQGQSTSPTDSFTRP